MTAEKVRALRSWFDAEFRHRTKMLEAGEGKISWLNPGTRVSFSEVCAKAEELELSSNPVELRLMINRKVK
jgi:hypothetical protein